MAVFGLLTDVLTIPHTGKWKTSVASFPRSEMHVRRMSRARIKMVDLKLYAMDYADTRTHTNTNMSGMKKLTYGSGDVEEADFMDDGNSLIDRSRLKCLPLFKLNGRRKQWRGFRAKIWRAVDVREIQKWTS